MTLSEHMAHMHHLMRTGLAFDRESALYHALNWALTFMAMRSSTRDKRISIHPQPQLRMQIERERQPSVSTVQSQSSGSAHDAPDVSLEEALSALGLDAADVEGHIGDDDAGGAEHPATEVVAPTQLTESPSVQTSSSATEIILPDWYRQPDFLSLITFRDGHSRVLFLHEAKMLRSFWEFAHVSDETEFEQLETAFLSVLEQAAEQAQFAFSQYQEPDVESVHVMVTVNFYFTVYKFTRERTPIYESGQDHIWKQLPSAQYGPYPLLRVDERDYHAQFKRCWTRIKNLTE